MTCYKFKLDLDVGALVKSPCKDCKKRETEFPRCLRLCKLIDRIQTKLAGIRSSTRNSS